MLFSTLWKGLPNLTHVSISLVLKPGDKYRLFSIDHEKIVYLDLSGCARLYLKSLNTPSLETLQIKRRPEDPEHDLDYSAPCLYDVLKAGAPNLKLLGDHNIQAVWLEYLYPELDAVLIDVCPCQRHVSAWKDIQH